MIKTILFFVISLGVIAHYHEYFFAFHPVPSSVIYDVNTSSDLDEYLSRSEHAVAGLKKDLAKGIVWNEPFSRKVTPYSIVYLHGFSASRMDLSPVVEHLSEKLQANAFYARFKAHGLDSGDGFATVSAQDWLDDAREALAIGRRIGKSVILIGTSTGGLLATMLALESQSQSQSQPTAPANTTVTPNSNTANSGFGNIAALILISPNFGIQDWRASLLIEPFGNLIVRKMIGTYRSFRVENAMQDYIWTHHYRSEGLVALNNLINYGKKLHLNTLKVPTLILYTSKDKVVDLNIVRKKFAEIEGTRRMMMDLPTATRHEFAGDALAPENSFPTEAAVYKFLKEVFPNLPQ